MVLAVWPLPSVADAVTVQVPWDPGAVNVPSLPIEPQVAVHVEGMVAVKRTVPLIATLGLCGEIVRIVPPTPERETAWEPLDAESVKVRLAARAPEAVGLNATLTEQLPATDSVAPQVVPETTKSEGFAPVIPMLPMVRREVLPLENTTVCGAVALPNSTLLKAMLAGLGPTMPVVERPETVIVCGLLLSESLKFNIALRLPVAVGPKTMLAVQLADGASVAPQVLL